MSDAEAIADELRTLARGLEAGNCEVTIATTRPVLSPGADAVDLEVEWHA